MEKDPTLAIKGTRKRRAAFTANRTYASELAWNAGSCSKYEGNYLKVTHIHTYFVEWRGDAAARTDHVKICERLLARSFRATGSFHSACIVSVVDVYTCDSPTSAQTVSIAIENWSLLNFI